MPRAPNYNHERQERDRAKANKKAEKLAAKVAAKTRDGDGTATGSDEQSED